MTKLWLTAALAALALAGCEQQPRESHWGPVPPPQNGETPPAALDTTFMQGDWTLATLGTYAPETPTRLTITAGRIEATSGCKHYAWTYQLTEQRLDVDESMPTEAGCAGKGSYWQQAFEETVTRANKVEMQMDGGLFVKGAGGEMELKR
ncbi:MAG TPA: META domain-containing protein [Caulobacteraceae bacterium]